MIKYIHIRTGDPFRIYPKGGFTIAYEFNPKTRTASYASARCSSKDHYCKATGREWSFGRWARNEVKIVTVPEAHSIVGTIVQHFFDHTKGL